MEILSIVCCFKATRIPCESCYPRIYYVAVPLYQIPDCAKSIIYLHRQFYVKGHAIHVTVDCLRVIGLKSMGSLHFLCELRMNK